MERKTTAPSVTDRRGPQPLYSLLVRQAFLGIMYVSYIHGLDIDR